MYFNLITTYFEKWGYFSRTAVLGLLLVLSSSPVLAQGSNQSSSAVSENISTLDNNGYLLGPGDQIVVNVFERDEFSQTTVILPDGRMMLPVLGSVMAAGHSPESLSQELALRLREYLVNPVVTVGLTTLRPVSVSVAGEVRRPGPLQLRSLTEASGLSDEGSANNLPRVSLALREAGGVTQNADIRQIVLVRNTPGGGSTRITINLWDGIWSENASEDVLLQDGDSILVPTLMAGEIDQRLLSRSSLAPESIPVRVIGEVNRPGEVQVSPNSSITSALASAGGPTENGRLSRVVLIRLNESGQIDKQTLDISELTDDQQVQEGDVIFVPEKSSSGLLDLAARLVVPFNFLLNIMNFIAQ